MTSPNDDPVIKQFRDQISDNDLKIIDLINKRLTLVDKLWRYKAEHGVDMYNPEREEWMVTFLSRANKGPLSQDALRERLQDHRRDDQERSDAARPGLKAACARPPVGARARCRLSAAGSRTDAADCVLQSGRHLHP